MGVRLVRYTRSNSGLIDARDHDELINRDLLNQHPIYAITGLQEVLNILEDSVYAVNELLLEKDKATNIRIDNILKDIDDINQMLADLANMNVIKHLKETYSLKLEYDETTKTLSGDVKVFDDKDNPNAIQVLAEGLYVPKTVTEDTNTITWSIESKGETLKEIYDNGMRFSHNSNSWSNIYSAAEANAWYWDNNLQSFVQPNNTAYFTGFVTKDFYDYYTHKVQLRSTNSDNDYNGLIIGFVFDENGRPHTLSIITFKQNGIAQSWMMVYDFMLPDQQVIATIGNGPGGTRPSNYSTGGWSSIGNGITVQVTKFKNLITATASNWNSTTLNEATKISIDLDDYSWGHLFRNSVRYGYCNCSQAYSFFQNIEFHSDNTASSETLFAKVKISEEPGNAISEKDDGIYAETFVISAKADNAITRETDGYHVEAFKISAQENNGLTKNSDGYYVANQGNIISVTQSGHGFAEGDFIYFHPINGYQKAKAIDSYDSNIVGMVCNVVDANQFEYQCSGFCKTDIFSDTNGYTQGIPLYISDVDAGKVTQNQPDISKAVGYPIENIGLVISIERGIQYNQEASIGDFKTSANTYNVRSDGFIRIIENVAYKQSLIQRLLDNLSEEFKSSFVVINYEDSTIQFVNTAELYENNNVPEGMQLFIKAF